MVKKVEDQVGFKLRIKSRMWQRIWLCNILRMRWIRGVKWGLWN